MNPEMQKPRLVIIVGATAVGKTDLALALAQNLGGEIISADSMQVYRHMDIGTAKPSTDQRARVRHHLLDVANPDEPFNAARFVETATPVIRALREKGTPILVVGGTGLYIRALLGGLFPGPAADEDLRRRYRAQQEAQGPDYLYGELQRIDELAARRINPHDTVRIIRALEVMALTGRSIVEKQAQHGFSDRPYDYIEFGLQMDRRCLYERIERRTREMMNSGLVAEVERLLGMGYGEDLRPMQTMGYKHIIAYIRGRITLDEAIRLTARDTRRYAKRQGTWFGTDAEIQWHSSKEFDRLYELTRRFLAHG